MPREREIPIVVPDADLVLEGRFQPGTGAGLAVVAPPHPLMGGSLDSPVVNEIAFALHAAGIASVRFNFRGVGASSGRATDDPRAAVSDYEAALAWLRESGDGPVFGCGYSFGAITSLRVALGGQALHRLILVGPPVTMLEALPLERVAVPVRVLSGDDDELAPRFELSRQVARIPDARLELLTGENHFFSRGRLTDLSELVELALFDASQRIELDG